MICCTHCSIWYYCSIVLEANLTDITIDQCENSDKSNVLNGTNKCHHTTDCKYNSGDRPFTTGNYWCVCKPGYYSVHTKFDGTLVEGKWNVFNYFVGIYKYKL